jgi:hypothetical protein
VSASIFHLRKKKNRWLNKRKEKRFAKIWELLWAANWDAKEHFRILERLYRPRTVRHGPKLYVLVYSNRDESYNHQEYHGKWAGMDDNSGGYPYATEQFGAAHIWYEHNYQEMLRYKATFPCLDAYELQLQLAPAKEKPNALL